MIALAPLLVAVRKAAGRAAPILGLIGALSAIVLLAYCVGRDSEQSRQALRDAQQSARVAEREGAANTQAAEQRGADALRAQEELQAINEVIKNAPPAPISSARQRYYDCLRLQQRARAEGREPSDCR